jgi:hypothetical protein
MEKAKRKEKSEEREKQRVVGVFKMIKGPGIGD